MKLLSENSPLIRFLSQLADFMMLNLIYLAFSIPLFTAGASTAALYSVMIHRSNGNESPVLRLFWDSFRSCFAQATLTALILLLPAALVCGDLYLLYIGAAGASTLLVWICLIPAAIFPMLLAYVFPLTAQFDNSPGQTVKNALLLAIGNLPVTLAVTALNLSPVAILLISREFFAKTLVWWLLVGFALVAWANEKLLHQVFKHFIPADEEK